MNAGESVRERALRLLGADVVAAVEAAPRAPIPPEVADRVAALLAPHLPAPAAPRRAA